MPGTEIRTKVNSLIAVGDSVCCGNFLRAGLKVFYPNKLIKLLQQDELVFMHYKEL